MKTPDVEKLVRSTRAVLRIVEETHLVLNQYQQHYVDQLTEAVAEFDHIYSPQRDYPVADPKN